MTAEAEWYLVQTKARQETVARTNLERQAYTAWLPRIRTRRARTERLEPLFPGYLFVRLSPDVDDFGPIRSTIGVLRLVRFGSVFARVPDAWVHELRSRSKPDDICEVPRDRLGEGDSVQISEGALAGYEAVVAELRGPDRVTLLLDVAGRHVSIVTSSESVRRID